MDLLNLVILFPLKDQYVQQIAAVDRRIQVVEAGGLLDAELGLNIQGRAPWVFTITPNLDVSKDEAKRKLDSLLAEAEVIYAGAVPRDLLARAPKLKWLQAVGTGVDNIIGKGILESGVTVTSAKGVQTITIPEWVLGFMFALAKQSRRLFVDQQERRWQHYVPIELHGRTLAIVGLGNIGGGLARVGKALGMRVVATRRSAMTREAGRDNVDLMYPSKEMAAMFAESDFVVICLPLTPETAHIIGAAELRAMKPTSYLINISRGGVVDEPVLIRALKEGWIAGAGLDVFQKEPLPQDSELWRLPNVIISPHMAGSTSFYHARATRLFCDNVRRYLSGQPLMNVVDPKAPY